MPRATTRASKVVARMMPVVKEVLERCELSCNECVCVESVSGRREALGVSWIRREEKGKAGAVG
jgi:SH3-like domain-containing protein